MQAYHDDRSDAWQQGDRAAALLEHLDALTQILDDLDALPPLWPGPMQMWRHGRPTVDVLAGPCLHRPDDGDDRY